MDRDWMLSDEQLAAQLLLDQEQFNQWQLNQQQPEDYGHPAYDDTYVSLRYPQMGKCSLDLGFEAVDARDAAETAKRIALAAEESSRAARRWADETWRNAIDTPDDATQTIARRALDAAMTARMEAAAALQHAKNMDAIATDTEASAKMVAE
jgi:hypothetical protein